MMLLILIILFKLIWNEVQSHVSLTYPAARNYRVDYITQANSLASCGMQKGDIKTSFLSGSKINVTWNLAYPHQGGFRLQLLDSLERPLLDLTPITSTNNFINDRDITTQFFEVELPSNYTCSNCTIRLVREAKEWGPDFTFWSCADIDILSRKEFRENCNSHGRYLIGRCICDRLFYGDKCQYRDECILDSDCGLFGKCEDLSTLMAPRKQCYCQIGWFGSGCGRKSAVKKSDIDFDKYKNRKLNENMHLYWRILDDKKEIEMIIVANATSYVAIGWRPKNFTECPINYTQNIPKKKKKRDNNVGTTDMPKSMNYTTSLIDFDTQLLENNTTVGTKLSSELMKKGAALISQPFHPMDCTDIVIGTVRNKTYRIADYFTRDQSTPQFDSFWGGKNDLVTALGYDDDRGQMVLLFRKKLIAEESTDHSITNEPMHLIWAKGQEVGQYHHHPEIELGVDKAKAFYAIDELKYHGYGQQQRGWSEVNFFEDTVNISSMNKTDKGGGIDSTIRDSCGGQYRYPPRCDESESSKKVCEYVAKWEYLYKNDEIKFTIKTIHTDKWTGIGFSNDEKMSQTDAIIGWMDSKTSQPFLMDTWILGYMRPVLDKSQDITNITGKRESDSVSISFRRKRISTDLKDLSFTDTQCLYMMYPVKGGTYNSVNKKIGKHEETPKVSLNRICIKPCQDFADYENEIEIEQSKLTKFPLSVKVIELGEHFQVPKVGTIEFQDLSNTISENFRAALNEKVDGLQDVVVSDLGLDKASDSVTVRMDLVIKNETAIGTEKIRDILWRVVRSGRANSLKLDNDFLIYEEPKNVPIETPSADIEEHILLSSHQLYVLVGCIAALVILTIMQASCTVYQNKCKQKKSLKQHYQTPPWRSTVPRPQNNYSTYNNEYERKYRQEYGTQTVTRPSRSTNSANNRNGYAVESKTLQRPSYTNQNVDNIYNHGALSLPRPIRGENQVDSPGRNFKPDFYFMPSQRKYAGEVVRVYVDHNGGHKRN